MVSVKRFDVCLINLEPTKGSEIKKTRPCVVISPDTMNKSRLRTVIIAPLTRTVRAKFPTRVTTVFKSTHCQIALDQVRAIDKSRIIKTLGRADIRAQEKVLHIIQVMFA